MNKEFVTHEEMAECKEDLSENITLLRADLQAIRKDTSDILRIYKNTKGFITFVGWISEALRWLVVFTASVGLAYAWFKGWLHGIFTGAGK